MIVARERFIKKLNGVREVKDYNMSAVYPDEIVLYIVKVGVKWFKHWSLKSGKPV